MFPHLKVFTQEAVGITITVYYAAVLWWFKDLSPASFSRIYWWHFDGICENRMLTHGWVDGIRGKCPLKDPFEAPFIKPPPLLCRRAREILVNAGYLTELPASSFRRCIPSFRSQTWWKPTSQSALRTGARRGRCARGMPISWCLTNA